MRNAWEVPAGLAPIVFVFIAAGVVAWAVEHWPEPRTLEQKQVDRLARDARARERQMTKRGWAR